MKTLITFLLLAPVLSLAQDCKIEKVKDQQGVESKMVYTPTALGKLMSVKTGDKASIGYMTRTIFSLSPGAVNLNIDSLQIIFSNYKTVTLKAAGSGATSNSTQIKPQYKYMAFGAELSSIQLELLKNQTITAFKVFGQKDSEGGDVLSKKQSINFQESFKCLFP